MKNLGFIGAGNMAEAMIKGLVASGVLEPQSIFVSDTVKSRLKKVSKSYGVKVSDSNTEIAGSCDYVVLAVKPVNIAEVLEEIRGHITLDKTLISIAAGVTTFFIEDAIGAQVKLVRVMPNTPALVGCGASVLYFNPLVKGADKSFIMKVFNSFGASFVIDTEELMDAVTGLSGSGPAFVAMFVEALSDGGVKMGLPRELALKLAAQTVLGTARILMEESMHPAVLKDKVSSPGGTTIEGIKALEENAFRAAVVSAVEAAARRSKELSGGGK
ncbi:MAG: pyrroline-5-carboxylate reductase [Thermodesulfobacteriota bacterium]